MSEKESTYLELPRRGFSTLLLHILLDIVCYGILEPAASCRRLLQHRRIFIGILLDILIGIPLTPIGYPIGILLVSYSYPLVSYWYPIGIQFVSYG